MVAGALWCPSKLVPKHVTLNQKIKVCPCCRIEKTHSEFAKDTSKKEKLQVYCKSCQSRKQYDNSNTFQGHLQDMLEHAKSSAKQRGKRGRVEASICSITIDDLHTLFEAQQGLCYYSGIQMSWASDKTWQMSIERLNETRGYEVDNVVLCCIEFNSRVQWSTEKIVDMVSILNSGPHCMTIDFSLTQKTKRVMKSVTTKSVEGVTAKLCTRCDVFKALDQYSGKMSICNKCNAGRVRCHNGTPRGSVQLLVNNARHHSEVRQDGAHPRQGEFQIDFDFVVDLYERQQGLCYYSGIPMQFGDGVAWKCSLERLDPCIDYTRDNTRLVGLEFNVGDFTAFYKHEYEGSSGWSKQKFQYFLEHVKRKYNLCVEPACCMARAPFYAVFAAGTV